MATHTNTTLAFLSSFLHRTVAKYPAAAIGFNDAHIQALISVLWQLTQLETAQDQSTSFLVLLPTQKEAQIWAHTLAHASIQRDTEMQLASVKLLPELNVWGLERFHESGLIRNERLIALAALLQKEPATIYVSSPGGVGLNTLTANDFENLALTLVVGREYDLDQLINSLRDLGYMQTEMVDHEGVFAIRGGILDIFPLNLAVPVRLDFAADTLASIREFQIDTQKSLVNLSTITIFPAYEANLRNSIRDQLVQRLYDHLLSIDVDKYERDGLIQTLEEGHFFQQLPAYLPILRATQQPTIDLFFQNKISLLLPFPLAKVLNEYERQLAWFAKQHQRDASNRKPSVAPSSHYIDVENLKIALQKLHCLEFGALFDQDEKALVNRPLENLPEQLKELRQQKPSDSFESYTAAIKAALHECTASIIVLAASVAQLEKLKNLLQLKRLTPNVETSLLAAIETASVGPGRFLACLGQTVDAAWFSELKIYLIPAHLIIGEKIKVQAKRQQRLKNLISSFRDLKVGDAVVHRDHGVARYLGMRTLPANGVDTDFLLLEYAGGDKLYVPVDKLALLHKYSSNADKPFVLDHLRGKEWNKKTKKISQAIRDLSQELLQAEAQRKLAIAVPFTEPGELFFRFETDFPYEETQDQLQAIQDVNQDLSRSYPMDRLICGDVGFGKTEIALRAAMRAVSDGYQVMVLVPTTVLCFQHYKTFNSRFERYGVIVGQLNRFVKSKLEARTLDLFKTGRLDILVGTHRILSQDVIPKRLGLVIVDEEQRFGVAQKERIKALRAGTDILTLTATPIPRTLHLSMLGLRDISVIATPPLERLPIKTYLIEFDEELLHQAIQHEISRGGQVFFVHNRVDDITELAAKIRRIAPEARIAIAHGQLHETALETVIIEFLEHRYDILLCTTIIESGIDMPNVNTLIVNNADHFGLSQLYQLRGRVGRSTRQSYSYMITPSRFSINDEARKRLEVLVTHQNLGAGFQIANYDLEMRGAGTLLGGEQSGHISDVGFELYTEMLEEAINQERGRPLKNQVDPEIKLPVKAKISEQLIQSEASRLQLYKSIFTAFDLDEVAELQNETQDRFGILDNESHALFKIAMLKIILRDSLIILLQYRERGLFELKFAPLSELQLSYLYSLKTDPSEEYTVTADLRLLIFLPTATAEKEVSLATLDVLLQKVELVRQLMKGKNP